MYGFPLTIYLLARFFGLDRYNLSANLWSSLVGVGELAITLILNASVDRALFSRHYSIIRKM